MCLYINNGQFHSKYMLYILETEISVRSAKFPSRKIHTILIFHQNINIHYIKYLYSFLIFFRHVNNFLYF